MVYSVFLSSTFGDFKEERKLLLETIPYIDIHVFLFERIGSDTSIKELNSSKKLEKQLQKFIDKSDAVILLVGLRYGSKSDDGLSWTEKEIHYALEKEKDVFCYIREHPEIDPKCIELSDELKNFYHFIKNNVKVDVSRYPHGKLCILTAQVIRDLDRWKRDKEEDSYNNSFI